LNENVKNTYFLAWHPVHIRTSRTRPLSTFAPTLRTHSPANTTLSLIRSRRRRGQRSSPCRPFIQLRSHCLPSQPRHGRHESLPGMCQW